MYRFVFMYKTCKRGCFLLLFAMFFVVQALLMQKTSKNNKKGENSKKGCFFGNLWYNINGLMLKNKRKQWL